MNGEAMLETALKCRDRGVNTFFAMTTSGSDADRLWIFADLSIVSSNNRKKGGGKHRQNGPLAKCNSVRVDDGGGLSLSVEVTHQSNLSINAQELSAQSDRSSQVQRCLTWGCVTRAEKVFLALSVDVPRALSNAAQWNHEETLGCGLRAVLTLGGRSVEQPKATARVDPAARAIDESIFRGSTTSDKDGRDSASITMLVPPFFLDRTMGMDEEACTHTLSCSLPSGSTLTVSIRRNTSSVAADAAISHKWVNVALSTRSNDASAAVSCPRGSKPILHLRVAARAGSLVETEGWVPVAVARGTVVDLSLIVSPEEEDGGSGLAAVPEDEEQAYRLVYEYLRPQGALGLLSLRMSSVFAFVRAANNGVQHSNQLIRDATRRYIVSARLGSPERPRVDGGTQRGGKGAATSVPSHDF